MAIEPGGPTAMLDAVYLAESKLRSARFERKAIVIISDGGDNASRLGKKWLSEITDATGGRTLTVDNRAKVPEAAATLSREMRNQYVLAYRPNVAG